MSDVPEIFWIEGYSQPGIEDSSLPIPAAPGLAIVARPRGDNSLEDELRQLKQGGIDTLVSLLEPYEADVLGLAEERATARHVGLHFLSYPIPDGQIPADTPSFRAFARGIADRLAAGEHVGVHCRGCIGRATITAACALIHGGWKARDALEAIAIARGYAVPDTLEQEDWILAYKPKP
jgi:protein-tyrosine phosphatase